MVEINNQRKAFLDMLAWSEGTDNGRQKTRKSWLWRHCRRRAIYWLLRSPSQTCHAKPKTQIIRRTLPASFPVGGMPTASSLAWKTSLRKVRTLWHCSIKSVALYPDHRGDIRQAIDRCSNIWASLPGAGYGQFEHKAGQPDCKIQRSGRNGQRDWCMSRVTAIISALVICIVCLSWAVVHYRDNAITYKAQRDKNARELKLANAAITDMQMRQRDVAAPRCKIHEGVSWC